MSDHNTQIHGPWFKFLPPELMSIQVLNPYSPHDSQSRQTMFASHISQALQMECAMPRFDPTGIERKYGQYTFKMQMPVDAYIRECIQKYPPILGTDPSRWVNPLTSVIYEYPRGNGQREFGVLNIDAHHCMHQYFGFRYKTTPAGRDLRPGTSVKAGTVFAQSPSINDEGDWMVGVEANVAVMTVPGVIEDGLVARKGMLDKMKVKAYGTRVVSWGKSMVPLNAYGDEHSYKPFPDIGENIRPDGLIFALRTFDLETAAVTMHKEALKQVRDGDRTTYIETNATNARVINVEVFRGKRSNESVVLTGMNAQCERYHEQTLNYYRKILKEYDSIRKENHNQHYLTPELINLVQRAQEICDPGSRNHMYLMNDAPLDEWMVKITFEYELTPTVGYKLTGFHGDKVVAVQVWADEDMPIDQWGNRADFIQDPDGTNRRMNLGRIYQHDFKAAMRETGLRFVEMWKDKSPANSRKCYEYLVRFYEILSPRFAALVRKRYDADPTKHLMLVERFVMKWRSLKVWMPTDNPISYFDAYLKLKEEYPVPVGPVKYRPPGSPKHITTKEDILIAPMYLMLLEKIGNGWSAVASAKVQHFDIPAKVSALDKYFNPGKQSPGRITGEGEVRLFNANTGNGEAVTELMSQNTNRDDHRMVTNKILSSDTPTNIARVIDRKKYPCRGGRVIEYTTHMNECCGFKYAVGDQRNANAVTRPNPHLNDRYLETMGREY